MKIVSISVTGKDSQKVTYLDDNEKEQTVDTPLIEEDTALLSWMQANVKEPVKAEKKSEVKEEEVPKDKAPKKEEKKEKK